jgi:AcrR family transcriptional regulator
MPKWFSEQEKENIRSQLLDQGEKHFSQFGFKKTNVDEIARAVGISKGAFYRFYTSKELLFMDVIEQVEIRGRREIMKTIDQPGSSPRARLFTVLKKAFDLFGELPILRIFTSSDFDMVTRGVPTETFQEHMASDRDFFEELFDRCQKAGIPIRVSAEEVVKMLYPLVIGFLSTNGKGEKSLAGNLNMHLELIAAYCLGEVKLEFQQSGEKVENNEEGKKE